MRAAGEIALYGGVSSALQFLSTKDGMERALMQGIVHQANELASKLEDQLAQKIANEVAKRFDFK
jgi:hypothetical protein